MYPSSFRTFFVFLMKRATKQIEIRYEEMKPSRQDIYSSVINRMVREALETKHNAFAIEHAQDTDLQLIAYIKNCTRDLGHTPHQKEIIGWPLITARFGTWGDALRMAKLSFPHTPNTPSQFAVMLNEVEEQKRIYREKKRQKKIQAQKRLAEQERRKRENPYILKKKRTAVCAAEE